MPDPQNKWTLNEEAFKTWLGNREKEFQQALEPLPTLKALIFLALLDRGDPCTYEEIGKIFEKQGVINGTIPVASLRVAMSELGSVLSRYKHDLQIQATRDGQREAKFQLVGRVKGSDSDLARSVVLINEPQTEQSGVIAETLLRQQSLPFHALYYLPRSACWWVTFSSEEAERRKYYEADVWEELKLVNLVASTPSSVIGMVGLAVGEGLGEIELLRKMLTDGYTVHYLAADLSPVLLVAHVETIREAFSQELREGRLLCAGILVDVFHDLGTALRKARSEFTARGVLARGEDFIPPDCAIVASFLGNCLGNDEPNNESAIFNIISTTFPENNPIAMVVGVSVMRFKNGEPEEDDYNRSWDEFLLQTPHHLLKNLGVLRSRKPAEAGGAGDSIPDEFTLPGPSPHGAPDSADDARRLQRCPEVKAEPYTANHGIGGQVYRFYYRLEYGLDMPRKKLHLPAGTEIVLYSIIKYKIETLIEGIRKRRFKVNYREEYTLPVETSNGTREYAVFVAYQDKKDFD